MHPGELQTSGPYRVAVADGFTDMTYNVADVTFSSDRAALWVELDDGGGVTRIDRLGATNAEQHNDGSIILTGVSEMLSSVMGLADSDSIVTWTLSEACRDCRESRELERV